MMEVVVVVMMRKEMGEWRFRQGEVLCWLKRPN